MADSSETQQDAELKKYISRYSLFQWMRIFDRMREERYKFYCPEKEFVKLEEMLQIRTGVPEIDREYAPLSYSDRAFYRITDDDILKKWNVDGGFNQRDQPSPVRRMEGETWSERYPDVHGKQSFPECDFHIIFTDFINSFFRPHYWGRIISQVVKGFHIFGGRLLGEFTVRVVGKRCRWPNHDGTTPLKWTDVDYIAADPLYTTIGSFQTIGKDRDGYYVGTTAATQFQIQDFEPPCEGPYYIAVVGMPEDSYQFNGMGFAEYPGAFNVLFEDGPIEGKYTSPLIGPGSVWITPDLNDFANNTGNKENSSGFIIRRLYLLLTPADGFRDYYIPDGEEGENSQS